MAKMLCLVSFFNSPKVLFWGNFRYFHFYFSWPLNLELASKKSKCFFRNHFLFVSDGERNVFDFLRLSIFTNYTLAIQKLKKLLFSICFLIYVHYNIHNGHQEKTIYKGQNKVILWTT